MALYADLAALPIIACLHTSLLRYITSLLFAGEMSLWLGPGLKYLQRSWTLPPSTTNEEFSQTPLSFALKLHLCLADVNWGGWKLIALPVLIKSTVKPDLGLLDREQRQLVAFLAALARGNKIDTPAELDASWKKKVETVVVTRLTSAAWKEGSADEAVCRQELLHLKKGSFLYRLRSWTISWYSCLCVPTL
jgi:U3 small nucleolar RNA-associated protein 20